MSGKHDCDLKQMEDKAEEFVALTYDACEKHLSTVCAPLTTKSVALSAATLLVQQSVATFLAVWKMPDKAVRRE
jgi:hypothetical protein